MSGDLQGFGTFLTVGDGERMLIRGFGGGSLVLNKPILQRISVSQISGFSGEDGWNVPLIPEFEVALTLRVRHIEQSDADVVPKLDEKAVSECRAAIERSIKRAITLED